MIKYTNNQYTQLVIFAKDIFQFVSEKQFECNYHTNYIHKQQQDWVIIWSII